MTIDQTIYEKNQRVDFLKIDVEGMEIEVICGAMNTIDRDKPVIMVESFDNFDKLTSLLGKFNYHNISLSTNDYLFFPDELENV